jgi:hypothetical protein
MTPPATKRTAFEKDRCPDTGPVVYRKTLYIEYDAFLRHYNYLKTGLNIVEIIVSNAFSTLHQFGVITKIAK